MRLPAKEEGSGSTVNALVYMAVMRLATKEESARIHSYSSVYQSVLSLLRRTGVLGLNLKHLTGAPVVGDPPNRPQHPNISQIGDRDLGGLLRWLLPLMIEIPHDLMYI